MKGKGEGPSMTSSFGGLSMFEEISMRAKSPDCILDPNLRLYAQEHDLTFTQNF